MRTWKCDVCGYVHRGAAPPERCPVCGVGSELFSLLEVAEAPAAPPPAAGWRCTICDYVAEGDAPPETCPICGAEASLFEPQQPPTEVPKSTRGSERIVVLGAGIAGMTAAEQARLVAPEAAVTLISKEPGLPYLRLNLSRLLAGEVADDAMPLQPTSWFTEQRIELVHDSAGATAIDRQARSIELGSGDRLPYDRLILATGAHAFVPPIAGATRAGVHVLRTLADVNAIVEQCAVGKRCVCIGGGILGLEAAGALARRGLAVTVLESFDWLLPRQLAEPAGRLLQRAIEQTGIAVRCGAQTEELVGDEEVRAVRIAGGDELPADLVVLATGVRPNSYLARQSGLEVNHGVVVDDRLATSDEAIFAAGDVAEHRGVVYGLWPHAYAQGMVAGANAAGASLEFHGLPPSNQLKVLDVRMFSIGEFLPRDGSYCVFEREIDDTYTRLVFHDGRIVGANLLGDTELAVSLKSWIENKTQVAEIPELRQRWPDIARVCPSVA